MIVLKLERHSEVIRFNCVRERRKWTRLSYGAQPCPIEIHISRAGNNPLVHDVSVRENRKNDCNIALLVFITGS